MIYLSRFIYSGLGGRLAIGKIGQRLLGGWVLRCRPGWVIAGPVLFWGWRQPTDVRRLVGAHCRHRRWGTSSERRPLPTPTQPSVQNRRAAAPWGRDLPASHWQSSYRTHPESTTQRYARPTRRRPSPQAPDVVHNPRPPAGIQGQPLWQGWKLMPVKKPMHGR